MNENFRDAVKYLKAIAKIANALHAEGVLAISIIKLIDALDSLAEDNYGTARKDIWAANAATLKPIVEAIAPGSKWAKEAQEQYSIGECEAACRKWMSCVLFVRTDLKPFIGV